MTMNSKRLLAAVVLLAAIPAFPQTAPEDHPSSAQAKDEEHKDDRLIALIALSATPLLPQAAQQDQQKPAAAAQAPQQHEDEGQRIFEQNCSRCHNAPEGFSPRISGTIVRHMRVRASLSQHEAEELLHFFNP
jgi:mono/diheme cytochrome c family protein